MAIWPPRSSIARSSVVPERPQATMNGKGAGRLLTDANASSRGRCYSRAAVAHRILYLVDSLGTGGAERGLTLTVRHLDRAKIEPEVAYLWEPSPLRRELEAAGAKVHAIG